MLKKYWLIILLVCGALSLGVYLWASAWLYRLGFPLDDAWIHQTYARNLATYGEWAFIHGQPSAGSTAPLWSGLLAIGYWIGLNPYLWTFLLGWAALSGLAVLGAYSFRVLSPGRPEVAAWVGVFMLLEWHLVWAAGSGMETLSYALIVLVVLVYIARGRINWLILGLLIGLSVWLRPDGITLIGPAIVVIYFKERDWRERSAAIGKLAVGICFLFLPYLLFNRLLAGAWWPNTFFAKQAEYAVLRSNPLWKRAVEQLMLPLVGVGVILLPGFVWMIVVSIRQRDWGKMVGAIWFLGFLMVYAWRLPVIYQHGRYVIPAMPIYFLWSIVGLVDWVKPDSIIFWRRTLSRTWILLVIVVLSIFWGLGLRAYALDVAVIESEMVEAAKWVAGNTEPDALIAAHDIGAMGYFAQRPLLDLAGLVSPQVIPFIRDELKLKTHLDVRGADYLVTFPGWYPHLVNHAEPLYITNGIYSPLLGGENLTVYRWNDP